MVRRDQTVACRPPFRGTLLFFALRLAGHWSRNGNDPTTCRVADCTSGSAAAKLLCSTDRSTL